MNWKFWEKKNTNTLVHAQKERSKPKDLHQDIGKHMVVKLGYDPDWVWSLKAVVTEKENKKGSFNFRAFDPVMAKANAVKVQGYNSLEGHPDLILFDGWYDKESRQIAINDHYKTIKDKGAA